MERRRKGERERDRGRGSHRLSKVSVSVVWNQI